MKNRFLIYFLTLLWIIPGGVLIADEINLKLPFAGGVDWLITRGYNIASHRDYGGFYSDDRFALDFALDGCDSFGLPHLSVADGVVIRVTRSNVGYGNTVLVEHINGIASRYAHLDKIVVTVGQPVVQGQILGTEGNTGNVFGSACPEHPGTHLHFAMYQNGNAYKPEPMSNYTNFRAWETYRSDNEIVDPGPGPGPDPGPDPGPTPPGPTPPSTGEHSFGGFVTSVYNCSCSGNHLLTIDNLSTEGPRPVNLIYQPGISVVYENEQIPQSGVWLNGLWEGRGESCRSGLHCDVYRYADGTVTFTGTSN